MVKEKGYIWMLVAVLLCVSVTPTDVTARSLPWYERYFFPIGAWCMPTNDNEDRLDYIDGTGKTIAYWNPQDYSEMLDHKLDYGRVTLWMIGRLDINCYNIINSVYIKISYINI